MAIWFPDWIILNWNCTCRNQMKPNGVIFVLDVDWGSRQHGMVSTGYVDSKLSQREDAFHTIHMLILYRQTTMALLCAKTSQG